MQAGKRKPIHIRENHKLNMYYYVIQMKYFRRKSRRVHEATQTIQLRLVESGLEATPETGQWLTPKQQQSLENKSKKS